MSSEQHSFDQASSAGDREFRELADFAPVMIWRASTDKQCDWFSRRWCDFVGRTIEQEAGFGWAEGVHPDDYDRCVAIYVEAFDAHRSFTMEYRLRRHDGEYRWLLDNGAPFERDGQFAGYFGSCIDITDYKVLEAQQRRMIDELNHRVKNTLAVVQSVAHQTFGTEQHPEVALRAFEGRLQALAGAHDRLTEERWESVSLRQLIHDTFTACFGTDTRVSIHGTDLRVVPQAAVSLTMAIHELCTNASKYGALSNDVGCVTIRWRVDGSTEPRFVLVWSEDGGPAIGPPRRRGFGTVMLERALAAELRGTVRLDYRPEGLRCTLDATFARLIGAVVPVTAEVRS